MSDTSSPNADLQLVPPPGAADEFAHLSPPPRRSAVAALAVLSLSLLLLVRLGGDLRYALESRTPVDLGDARTLSTRGVALEDNRYVTLSGLPDRRNALYVEPRGERVRELFFRLLGTDNRLLVRAADSRGQAELADRWTGRLRRVDTLPWAPSLRTYFTDRARARRYFPREELGRALSTSGDVTVRDRLDQPLLLAAGVELAVDLERPDWVRVLLSKERFAALEDARRELERLGLGPVVDVGPADAYAFVVPIEGGKPVQPSPSAPAPAPSGAAPPAPAPVTPPPIGINSTLSPRDRLLERLSQQGFAFEAAHLTWQGARSAFRVDGSELVAMAVEAVAADGTRRAVASARLPLGQVVAASIDEPVALAPDAFVLTEGESPAGFVWAPALGLLLVGFALFNAWSLLQGRRRG
jgi:hypothetical protein